MPIEYLNFVDQTVPAGATAHKATGGSVAPRALPTPPAGTEAVQADVDAVEASDDVRWQNTIILGNMWPYHMYRFYVDPEKYPLVVRLLPLIEGLIPDGPGQSGYTWHIYNHTAAAWELGATSGSGAPPRDDTLSFTVRHARHYFTAERYVYVAALNVDPHTAVLSKRWDDYVQLGVDWLVGDRNINRNIDGRIDGLIEYSA